MPQVADLRAKISVDGAEKAKSDLKGVHSSVSTLADGFKTGLGAVTGFVTGFAGFSLVSDAIGAVTSQMGDWIQGALQAENIAAETNRILTSQSHVMGLTAGEVDNLATQLMNLSGVDDDVIHQAENILAGFSNISAKAFPDVTKTALDMAMSLSVSTGSAIDVTNAAHVLGLALQDPAKGARLLRTENIILTDAQQKTIASLMKHHDVAKADALIMDIVKAKVAGAAEAYGQTNQGKIDRFRAQLDNLGKQIAGVLLPIIGNMLDKYVLPLVGWLGEHLPDAITKLEGVIDKQLIPTINGLMDSPVVKTLEGWATAIAQKVAPALGSDDPKALAGSAKNAAHHVFLVDKNATTLGNNLSGPFLTKVQKAIDKLDGVTTSLGGDAPGGKGLNPAVLRVNANLAKMDQQLDASGKAAKKAQQPTEFLGGLFDQVGLHIQGAGNALGNFAAGVQQRLGPAIPTVKKILGEIGDDFSLFGTGIHDIWDGIWGLLATPVKIAFHQVEGIVNVALDVLGGNFAKANQDTAKMFNNLKNDVEDGMKAIGGIIKGLGESILGWFLAPFKGMWKQTKPLLDQFGNDFKGWVLNWSHTIQQYINDHMPHIPGISLPGMPSQTRASGGPVSGDFLGAERGPELLVTPGVYHAPPGSYVYNAQQTAQMLSGNGGGGGITRGGDTYHITVIGANRSAAQLFDEFHREADRRRRMHG